VCQCLRLTQGVPSKRCAGCKEALYCSCFCQKAAWKITGDDHRSTCIPRTRRLERKSYCRIAEIAPYTSCFIDGEPIRTTHDLRFLKGVLQYELGRVFETARDVADGLLLRLEKSPDGQAHLVIRMKAESVHWDVDLLAACPTEKRQELWSDVFDELERGAFLLILVRIEAVCPSMKQPAMAYCCIPRPEWMPVRSVE
jgi:hypothetical protein